jgi:uncharacterized RDD family membrane protein YckC
VANYDATAEPQVSKGKLDMLTRFDILLIILILLAVFGFPGGIVGNRLPPYLTSIVLIVVLAVLLLLGVVRY